MSSPSTRKILLGSPAWLANPKNFRLMGGGGGGGGGPVSSSFLGAGTPGGSGCGISACARNMLRPLPSYLVSSLVFSQSYRKVGSSERGPAITFLTCFLECEAGREEATGRDAATGA